MLHGCTQTATDFAVGTRMNVLAEGEMVLVVYPEQAAAANCSGCWNWFQTAEQQRGAGEPSLIAGITQQIMSAYHVEEGVPVVGALVAHTVNEECGGALHPARDAARHIGLGAVEVGVRRHVVGEPLRVQAHGPRMV